MRTVFVFCLLVSVMLTSIAQTPYRFLTPIRVPGLIAMEPVTSLPTNPGMFSLVNQGGKVWISTLSGWEQLWPIVGGLSSADTLTFSDGSRIFGGGGQIDIQPAAGIGNGARLSAYTAGGGDTLILGSNNKRVILNFPVTYMPNYVSFQDSVYLDYIGAGSITGRVYLNMSPTQAIDTGRTRDAAIGTRMALRPIEEQVADTVAGEMRWWYYDPYKGKWVWKYGVVTTDPIATDEAHTVQIELLTRYIYDLQKQIDTLKPRKKFTRRSK